MRCQAYSISPLALLCKQLARPLPPTTFFQQWSSAPSGISASCCPPQLPVGESCACVPIIQNESNSIGCILAGLDLQLSAARGGVMGGLLALSALERSALQRVALQALPCQGGFLGLYHGTPLPT